MDTASIMLRILCKSFAMCQETCSDAAKNVLTSERKRKDSMPIASRMRRHPVINNLYISMRKYHSIGQKAQ